MTMVEERRLSMRFPIEQAVRYRLKGQRPAVIGEGRTVNLSSRGVLFTTDRILVKGSAVQVEISWPILLDDSRPLKLIARGPIIWCDGAKAAMKIEGWEFHTWNPSIAEDAPNA
jgi:hypothetical protein